MNRVAEATASEHACVRKKRKVYEPMLVILNNPCLTINKRKSNAS
jgi:hypothetical protein